MDPSTQLLIAKIAIPGALGVAGIILVSRYFSVRKRQAWPRTEGQVLSAEVAQGNQTGRRGKTFEAYWAEVKFRYEVKGEEYQNDRIAADRILFRSGGPAKNIVQLYHPEQKVEVWYNPDDPKIKKALVEQDLSLEGKRGGILWIVRTADGTRLTEMKLESAPVFDGMAVAGGRIYLTTRDGTLLCLGD